MRHDKLRQWHEDNVPRDPETNEQKIIPHQSVADQVEPDPKQDQSPRQFSEPDDVQEDLNDEDITDGFPDEYEQLSQEQQQYADEQQPGYSEIERQAMSMGWVPKEHWRGDPDDWTSAKRFVQTGELIQANRSLHQKVNHLEQDFNNRLLNQQRLHEAQLKLNIENLKKARQEAVEHGDAEKFNELDNQLRMLEQDTTQGFFQPPPANYNENQPHPPVEQTAQPQPPATPNQPPQIDQQALYQNLMNHPVVKDWRERNPWIEEQSPKTAYAEREFVQWVQRNISNPAATVEEGLAHVDNMVKSQFNSEAPQRARPSMSEKRGGPRPRQAPRLTMNDLTREEKMIWQTMGKSWKSQDDFLQAVKDNREAERKNTHAS